MELRNLWERVQGRYQQTLSKSLFPHRVKLRNKVPLISFTFDDFPRSALQTGGDILKRSGVRGTYYVALGLLGQTTVVGDICNQDDLAAAFAEGHELGCHTFSHCHAWHTSPGSFEQSVIDNRHSLGTLLPQAVFRTLSYPKADPRPRTKRRLAKYFLCCRAGGQSYNLGRALRTHVTAYFLEQCRGDASAVKRVIDANARDCGWLVFATHDVCPHPSRFGCTPGFFEEIVNYSVSSGATILPVDQAWKVSTA